MNIKNLLPSVEAEAHCDIPCGIYEPAPAKIAAKTVARMVDQIEGLEVPNASSDAHAIIHYQNSIARRIAVKEHHAQLCEHELETLWSDFFKAEHLTKFPDLHDMFWKAIKLCSKNKQEVDKEAATQLVAAVDEVAKIFYAAKGVSERFTAYQEITDKLY